MNEEKNMNTIDYINATTQIISAYLNMTAADYTQYLMDIGQAAGVSASILDRLKAKK